MATLLREMYEVLSSYSTATHLSMCKDLIRQLDKGKRKEGNLAGHFARAITENRESLSQVDVPFIPTGRDPEKKGTNPVTHIMRQMKTLQLSCPETTQYEFKYLGREIPHLRARNAEEQNDKAWIDYVACTKNSPILGEVKWKGDENPFYALIQLLVYLSEMATTNQIARAKQHGLFGDELCELAAFDLHIFLANFNERGKKGKLIEKTHRLAALFKSRLLEDHPDIGHFVGSIMCISATVEEGGEAFSELRGVWAV
jgi:hypothetical protein